MVDITDSIDIFKNFDGIQKSSGEGDGGASGEFFYITTDRRIIIKTISNEELAIFKSILQNYYKHFQENEHSLITKIYGVFSFDFN